MSAVTGTAGGSGAAGGAYESIQRFYAHQAQLLGAGDIAGWAATFTEDALFEQNARSDREHARNTRAVRRGRADIASIGARGGDDVVRRYWLGLIDVTGPAAAGEADEAATTDDATVRTSYYGVLVQGRPGVPAGLAASIRGEDTLRRTGDGWLVSRRQMFHDDNR